MTQAYLKCQSDTTVIWISPIAKEWERPFFFSKGQRTKFDIFDVSMSSSIKGCQLVAWLLTVVPGTYIESYSKKIHSQFQMEQWFPNRLSLVDSKRQKIYNTRPALKYMSTFFRSEPMCVWSGISQGNERLQNVRGAKATETLKCHLFDSQSLRDGIKGEIERIPYTLLTTTTIAAASST